MREMWTPIEGFEDYLISTFGAVYSLKTKKYMSPCKMKNGYMHITLSKGNKKHSFYIHRLVASAFIPNPHCLPQVNHIDENKENNIVFNLEWCDSSYNVNYGTAKWRTATTLKAKDWGNKIRCIENGAVYPSFKAAARELGISQSEISRMISGKRIVNSVREYHFELVAFSSRTEVIT